MFNKLLVPNLRVGNACRQARLGDWLSRAKRIDTPKLELGSERGQKSFTLSTRCTSATIDAVRTSPHPTIFMREINYLEVYRYNGKILVLKVIRP